MSWEHETAPVVPPAGEGWRSVWTANPDFLEFEGRLLLYFRATGFLAGREGEHDRIGVAEVLSIAAGDVRLEMLNGDAPVVDVGEPEAFDGTDVLDPATVVFQGKVFLYYSAIGPGPDSVGLAVSKDGVSFTKVGKVLTGRAPDVIGYGDKLRMVYQKADAAGNYQVYLAESSDGITFEDVVSEPVIWPTAGSWDSLSIATVRLEFSDGWYFALYGGSSYLADEPDFFGLARSKDLVDWQFHPGNPVFGCGAKGAPDGGAIWFPALRETSSGQWVMLYEGSRGKYAWDLCSAVCAAWL